MVGDFAKLYIWSDVYASQFRWRFVFLLLSHFHPGKKTEWHFNRARDGKGLMDGVGGTIKTSLSRSNVFRIVLKRC